MFPDIISSYVYLSRHVFTEVDKYVSELVVVLRRNGEKKLEPDTHVHYILVVWPMTTSPAACP